MLSEGVKTMSEHTYDWATKVHATGEKECYHLAVAQFAKDTDVEGRIAAMLGTCLKCSEVTAITPNYRKTDRVCGDKQVYVRQLFR